MNQKSIMEHFINLQLSVLDSVNDIGRKTRQKIWSLRNLAYFYRYLMLVFVMSIFILVLVPKAWLLITFLIEQIPANDYTTIFLPFRFVLLIFLIAGWPYVVYCPVHTIASKFPRFRGQLQLFQAIIVAPVLLFGTDWLLDYLIGRAVITNDRVLQLVGFLWRVDIMVLFAAGLVIWFASGIPTLVVLILAGTGSHGGDDHLPSHDEITKHALDQSRDVLREWSEATVMHVDAIARHKLESLGAQVQALSPILGAIGLLSLFTLIISQETIQGVLRSLNDVLRQFSSGTGTADAGMLLIFLLVLVVIVGGAYFARTYRAMRILEIVIVLCSIRLEELKREQATIQAQQGAQEPITVPASRFRRRLIKWLVDG